MIHTAKKKAPSRPRPSRLKLGHDLEPKVDVFSHVFPNFDGFAAGLGSRWILHKLRRFEVGGSY